MTNQADDMSQFDSVATRRILTTVSCRDTDALPKVPGSGECIEMNGQELQRMHNGILIEKDAYCGPWMTEIIKRLHGHHEPQEEIVFSEVLKRLGDSPEHYGMIELGCWWSYYMMWYKQEFPKAPTIGLEPDPLNLAVAERHHELNGMKSTLIQGAVGADESKIEIFAETLGETIQVQSYSLASLLRSLGQPKSDMLLVDIQGAELAFLEESKSLLQQQRIRYVFVSTHHDSISENPLIHEQCLELLQQTGATIVAEHTVSESYSGDGLIVASYEPGDEDFNVPVSRCRAKDSFFGAPEERIAQYQHHIAELIPELDRTAKVLENEHAALVKTTNQLAMANAEIERIHRSRSWRFTAPLRRIQRHRFK